MKLRELFDKAQAGLLDNDVNVKLVTNIQGANRYTVAVKSEDHPLARVDIEDDGTVTLVVETEA